MPTVIHLVGAPASGKTWLRHALGESLLVPTFDIDEERRRLNPPGRPRRDGAIAWEELRASIDEHPAGTVIETSGLSPNDAWLFEGIEQFVIRCSASELTRRARLTARLAHGDPYALAQRGYVNRLLTFPDLALRVDAEWDGESDNPGPTLGPLVAACRAFLGQRVEA